MARLMASFSDKPINMYSFTGISSSSTSPSYSGGHGTSVGAS
jgi:hypothetical protein